MGQSVCLQPPPRPHPRGMCGPRDPQTQPVSSTSRYVLTCPTGDVQLPCRRESPPPQCQHGSGSRLRGFAALIQSAFGGDTAHARGAEPEGRGACWGLKSPSPMGWSGEVSVPRNPVFEPLFRAEQPPKPIFSLALPTGLPSALCRWNFGQYGVNCLSGWGIDATGLWEGGALT